MIFSIIYRLSTSFNHPFGGFLPSTVFQSNVKLAPAQYPPWALFLGQCSGSQGRWHMMALYEKYGGFLMVTHKIIHFSSIFWAKFPMKTTIFLPSRMGIRGSTPRLPVGSHSWLSLPLGLLRRSWTERRQNPATCVQRNDIPSRSERSREWSGDIPPISMARNIWYMVQ